MPRISVRERYHGVGPPEFAGDTLQIGGLVIRQCRQTSPVADGRRQAPRFWPAPVITTGGWNTMLQRRLCRHGSHRTKPRDVGDPEKPNCPPTHRNWRKSLALADNYQSEAELELGQVVRLALLVNDAQVDGASLNERFSCGYDLVKVET